MVCSVLELFCLKPAMPSAMEHLNGVAGIPYLNEAYENNIDDEAVKDDERYSHMPGELHSEMADIKHGTKINVELTSKVIHRAHAQSERQSVDSDRTEDALAIEKGEAEGQVCLVLCKRATIA